MIWGEGDLVEERLRDLAWVGDSSPYLLGFNEPNYGSQVTARTCGALSICVWSRRAPRPPRLSNRLDGSGFWEESLFNVFVVPYPRDHSLWSFHAKEPLMLRQEALPVLVRPSVATFWSHSTWISCDVKEKDV